MSGKRSGGEFSWTGWFTGEDCEPPEPGKEWLEISEDGNEYAVIVLRLAAFSHEDDLAAARIERENRAQTICNALNL